MTVPGYYPTNWPFKGTVLQGTTQNEDRIPVYMVALQHVIRFWEGQDIDGKVMRSLLINAKFALRKAEKAYASPTFLSNDEKFVIVGNLADMLDRLAPEGLYFGAKHLTVDDYGYWNAQTLITPYAEFL